MALVANGGASVNTAGVCVWVHMPDFEQKMLVVNGASVNTAGVCAWVRTTDLERHTLVANGAAVTRLRLLVLASPRCPIGFHRHTHQRILPPHTRTKHANAQTQAHWVIIIRLLLLLDRPKHAATSTPSSQGMEYT